MVEDSAANGDALDKMPHQTASRPHRCTSGRSGSSSCRSPARYARPRSVLRIEARATVAGTANLVGVEPDEAATLTAALTICTRHTSAYLPLAVGLEDRPASSCIGYACLGSARMDLVIWVVVLVAAIVIPAGALTLKLRPRPGAQIVLAIAYLRALRTTNDKKESLRRALTVLRNRPLFADLRDEDITFLAELFEDCRHPQVALGQVVHLAESRRSPRRLQDHDSLRAFVAGARKEGA